MAKTSAFLMKLQAQERRSRNIQRLFTIQQMEDVAPIVLAQEFGFGETRILRYRDALRSTFRELCEDAVTDAESDDKITYTKARMDRALKPILGAEFRPWEERYQTFDTGGDK